MRGFTLCGVFALGAAAPAAAQVLEGFEHGNVGLYTPHNANLNMTIVAGAAHDGSLGARFTQIAAPAFFYRTDIVTSPGNTYYCYVRVNGPGPGRFNFGVAASAAGAFSAVAAPNTGELLLQNNVGYGFGKPASVPFTWSAGTWYRLGIRWESDGRMSAVVWNEAGTLLAQTTPVVTNAVAGGIALRAFHLGNLTWDCDTITKAGAACYPDCDGVNGLTVQDFGCFQTKFVQGDPYADCDGQNGLTVQDFGCFQTKFVQGCPP